MDCPVCKSAMITLELAKVEIDYCTGCKGVWLDAGELEMLLEDKGKAKKLIQLICQRYEQQRKGEAMPDMRQEDGKN